ncbi:PREDICTED: transposon, partial [Prunus dulcis]
LMVYVQNHTRPEGCVAEQYIAKYTVEFCTRNLSNVSTVGVPSKQKMGLSKPLSGCTMNLVDRDLLNQAHLYVLENMEEVQSELNGKENNDVSENLSWLEAGPSMAVPSYKSYLIN